jgi:3-hydroxybutyryl-CoA dehydrogenase
MMSKRSDKTIVILGDQALVSEYGQVCADAGWNIVGSVNKYSTGTTAPPSFMKPARTIPGTVSAALELTNLDNGIKKTNLQFLERSLPNNSIILSSSVTVTANEQQAWLKSPHRLVGISAFPTLASKALIEVAPSVHTASATVGTAVNFLEKIGKETSIIQDRIGMVMPRIICSLINESCFAAGEHIASAQDIDTAMKLGTNYPFGPFEWANAIGFDHVFAVLHAIHNDLGEERYRIAPLLRQMAYGKRWWKT